MSDTQAAPRQSSTAKLLLPVFLVVAVDVLALTIIIPFLPFYAQSFGASPSVVGLLISSYAVCQLFAGPALGAWSDRVGRRRVLIVSQIGTFIGLIILARANALWVVFLSRIIDGITAGNLTVAQAYLADVTKPEERAKGFAVIGIAFGLGFFIGPAISGMLAHYGPAFPVYGAAGLSLLSVFGTILLLKEPERHAETTERRLGVSQWSEYAEYLKNPGIGQLLIQFFCFTFPFSLFVAGFPLFAERRLTWDGHYFGVREVGLMYAFSGFLGIIIQGRLVGLWARRYGEMKMTLWAFAAALAGYAVLSASYRLPLLIVAAILMAFGTGVLRPALTALISQNASRQMQGGILGFTQSVNSLSQIFAPILAGVLIEYGFLSGWALTAAGLSLIGWYLALRMSRSLSS